MNTKSFLTHTKKYRAVLSAVHMVYRLVNSTFNTKELALRLTRLVCQIIDASSSDVFLYDAVKKRIVLVASYNNKINMLIDRRKEMDVIAPEERAVAESGATIIHNRLIGLPLVSDENIGALFIRRKKQEKPFTDFDKEILSTIAEQAVTAIKNIQLYENQQRIILSSMKSIGKLLKRQAHHSVNHAPVYFKIIRCLAEKLHMSTTQIECLHYVSILHNAGALDVPYEILSKTSQLSADEFKVIRDHPAKSVELIKPVEFLKPVLPMILYHREKFDGTGYPSGLRREQIPLGARVMAVVDAFEAMTCGRPYREKFSVDGAIIELNRNRGTQFDPKIVDAFCELSKQKKFRKYLSSISQ